MTGVGAATAARIRCAGLFAVIVAIVAACAPPAPTPAAPVGMPADFPEAYYRQVEAQGKEVLRVDSARSLVVVEVGRAGALARLGHDHVVASHDVVGYVAPAAGRADLYVRLDRLVVDEPGLRAEAGFDTQPSPAAIEGTRRNMLEKVLDTERFPVALIHVTRRDADHAKLNVSITLRGMTRAVDIPVRIETVPGGLAIGGRMTFNQSDFGITPFSALGGALQVRDNLALRFRIVAGGS